MTDYRETIRLNSLGFSNRNTISEVLAYAEKHSISWPIPEALTNMKLIFMHMILWWRYTNSLPGQSQNWRDQEHRYNPNSSGISFLLERNMQF